MTIYKLPKYFTYKIMLVMNTVIGKLNKIIKIPMILRKQDLK
jgi:hypothetical protein